jgi:hypothetical protein
MMYRYLKKTLDVQIVNNIINKRENFVLNKKEMNMNHTIINKMNKSNLNSADDIQEELIQSSGFVSSIPIHSHKSSI